MVLFRDESGLHPCKEREGQAGFFDVQDGVLLNPLLKSNPIEPNIISPGVLWTRKPRRLVKPKNPVETPEITRDGVPGDIDADNLNVMSDAAVHVEQAAGAAAWQILLEDGRKYSARITLDVYQDSYSYREELMGIYNRLRDVLRRFPRVKAITFHCDCKSAIDRLRMQIEHPGQLMKADMDIVLAIKKLVELAEAEVQFVHIKGHAERRKPISQSQMTTLERANMEVDRDAEAKVALGETPIPFAPLPGSRCMLWIKNKWITSRPDEIIQRAFVKEPLEEYTAQRLKIPLEVVAEIDQEAIGNVRGTHRWARLARVSKLLFHWLPVGHNWKHHGAENDLCPCCGEPDETFIHLLQCTDPGLSDLRQTCIGEIREAAVKLRIPPAVYSIMILILRRVHEAVDAPPPAMSIALQRAWESQQRIGFNHMAIGWISKEWGGAMKAHGSKDPGGQVAQMLALIWDSWCEPIWEYRNSRFNDNQNPAIEATLSMLGERLQWYYENKVEVLATRHRFLAEFRLADVIKWDRRQRQTQLKMLDDARRIYEIESRQRVRGQRVITEMFLPVQPILIQYCRQETSANAISDS
jgi:hypothetical protein